MRHFLLTILMISFQFSLSHAQIQEEENPVLMEEPSERPAPKPKVKIENSYTYKEEILAYIDNKDLEGFTEFISNTPNTEEILIEQSENILRYLLKKGEMDFAEPLMELYLAKHGTRFPKSSKNVSSVMYLNRACSSCQIKLLKTCGDEVSQEILKRDQLRTNLISSCDDEQSLIRYFEKVDAIKELPEEEWPLNAIAAIENNRLEMISYLIEKKNLKLDIRSFHNQVNTMKTMNFLWDLGMKKTGLPEGARYEIVRLLWRDASVDEIEKALNDGIVFKQDLLNDRKIGSDFLQNADAEKIKYIHDLYKAENKTIRLYRINSSKRENKRVFSKEEMYLILNLTEDYSYPNIFKNSLAKPADFDEEVKKLIFQTCLAKDQELFDYLLLEKNFPVLRAKSDKERNVLHYAAIAGDVEFFKHLCERHKLSALLELKDIDGKTPLNMAEDYSRTEILDYLTGK